MRPTQEDLKQTALSQDGGSPRHVVVFRVTEGEGQGQTFRVAKERIVIGSVASADVRLQLGEVAPIHAVMELLDGVSTIYDLASETGLFVNGEPVVLRQLKAGDSIRCGSVGLSWALEKIPPVPAPAASGPVLPQAREFPSRRPVFNPATEDLSPLLLEEGRTGEEIFEDRPAVDKALEVVMSWSKSILDVQHFGADSAVTVGTERGCDFPVAPLLDSGIHELVCRDSDGAQVLRLDPRMDGVIQRNGRVEKISDLRGDRVGVVTVPFAQGDFAKIAVGEVVFYLSYTAAPPHLRRRKVLARDPFFFRVAATSLGLTLALVLTLNQVSVPKTVEAEQLPDRIATILYQPEKYAYVPKPVSAVSVEKPKTPEPQPSPAVSKLDLKPGAQPNQKKPPKPTDARLAKGGPSRASGQREAKEGEGARAKGREGSRGTRHAKDSGAPQTLAKRPSPQAGDGPGGANSQLEGQGNVDFLKGASSKIQDLLGGASSRLGKGGSKLQGFGGFNTVGNGGLALSGTGKGGGGNAETTLGGLGNKGTGGGRVGTGQGAAGSGSGIVGGKARVVIRSGGPEEAVVMGAIDAAAVEAALLAHRNEFRYCYEREVNTQAKGNPALARISGRVGTSFTIGPTGRVNQTGVESSSLGNRTIEDCILEVIRSIDFPVPRGGGVVQVTYPFKFSASAGG